jgi:hypothetical protein
MLHCNACGADRPEKRFSRGQLKKGAGRRCKACIGAADAPAPAPAALAAEAAWRAVCAGSHERPAAAPDATPVVVIGTILGPAAYQQQTADRKVSVTNRNTLKRVDGQRCADSDGCPGCSGPLYLRVGYDEQHTVGLVGTSHSWDFCPKCNTPHCPRAMAQVEDDTSEWYTITLCVTCRGDPPLPPPRANFAWGWESPISMCEWCGQCQEEGTECCGTEVNE